MDETRDKEKKMSQKEREKMEVKSWNFRKNDYVYFF